MLSIEEMRELLKDRNASVIASITGLSAATIRDIKEGRNTNPTMTTAQKLSDYLTRKAA
mgnify:FL=1